MSMRLLDPHAAEVEAGIKRLNNAKVRFPDGPVDVELYFGLHGSEGDLPAGFGDILQQADVLSLEQVGWAQPTLELTQRLADGEQAALEELDASTYGMQKGFWHAMHRAIFESGVRIHNPDVPRGHALALRHDRATEGSLPAILALRNKAIRALMPPPPGAVEELTDDLFDIYQKREQYMLGHFFPKELPEADRLKVVGFFGVLHSGIATALARQAGRQGREDIRIFVNDFETLAVPPAYENFLAQQPNDTEALLEFLTTDFKESEE